MVVPFFPCVSLLSSMCLRLVASTLAEEYAVEGKMMFLCFASPGLAHHDGGGHFVLGTPVAVML